MKSPSTTSKGLQHIWWKDNMVTIWSDSPYWGLFCLLSLETQMWLSSVSRVAKLPGWTLAFHQLRLSMEHHMRVNIIGPDWGSVNLSQHHPAEIRLLSLRRERWLSDSCGIISDPYPLVGTSIFLPWWSEPTLAIRSEGLAKGPNQKNTRPAARLKPTIYKLQLTQALTNWDILSWLDETYKTEMTILGTQVSGSARSP